MAPHLAQEELDWIQKRRKLGLSPSALHKLFVKFREGKGITAPHITQFRKVLKGITYRRGVAETRGRKKT